MPQIRIALADDSFDIREAIKRIINNLHNISLLITAIDGFDLLKKLSTQSVDIVLLDIRMPKMNGIETAAKIKSKYPNIKIIAYTQFDLPENVIQMSIVGVQSFIGKDEGIDELIRAIKIVNEGGVYLPTKVAEIIQNTLKLNFTKTSQIVEMSESELNLLKYICSGLSSTQIAELINKSPRTVEVYRNSLYGKFDVSSKEELITRAIKAGLF